MRMASSNHPLVDSTTSLHKNRINDYGFYSGCRESSALSTKDDKFEAFTANVMKNKAEAAEQIVNAKYETFKVLASKAGTYCIANTKL